LARTPESAAAARRLVVRALAVWDLPELADAAALVVSELVSNAVRHASGARMRVTVARVDERRVRVAVLDGDRTRPRVRCPGPGGERGRGLLIVAAEAVAWGADLLPGGKCVWADCTADHASTATGAGPDRGPGRAGAGAARLPGPDFDVDRSDR
jgi:anti-sigma regulatory factor (Ser/Thr protein kinase)